MSLLRVKYPLMKKFLTMVLCSLFALAAPTYAKRIVKNPEALGWANVSGGELKAREVVLADTATTLRLTLDYPAGSNFRIMSTCYLLDEAGRRYPLRSAEGLPMDTWVTSPADRTTDFTLHFEPLPRRTQVFDFIEYDGQGAFMLLGIHDRKHKLRLPTLDELSGANACNACDGWFTTDSVTLRGRIEGYSPEAGFPTILETSFQNIFRKEDMIMVADIRPDGTFEKRWLTDHPMQLSFGFDKHLPGISWINVFASPGDTIDLTLRRDAGGQYSCDYLSGSSRAVERWLKADLEFYRMCSPLSRFEGTPGEAEALAERLWRLLAYRLHRVAAQGDFTPEEMQLAIADAQASYATSVMDYALNKELLQVRNGMAIDFDSLGRDTLTGTEFYSRLLSRIDFGNPLLMASSSFGILLNRMQYAWPVGAAIERQVSRVVSSDEQKFADKEKAEIDIRYATLRAMMGVQDNNLMAQLCNYLSMCGNYRLWRTMGGESVLPYCLESFTHEALRRHAEAYHAFRQASAGLATPLPEGQPAELIRSLLDRYPGRYLLIDFWDMGCGPCKGAIQSSKELRAEIAKRHDVKLIFIAGEESANGSEAYHKYVEEWLSDETTICIPRAEFCRLQEYFGFNAIPHYETITPDARRVDKEYRIDGFHNFYFDIERLLKLGL